MSARLEIQSSSVCMGIGIQEAAEKASESGPLGRFVTVFGAASIRLTASKALAARASRIKGSPA
ncbi:hypothetical protein KBY65_12985 [Cyanobium sp. Alchichica 3B3-8F6]|uniref:hypothetical protein n=1 Tax=Cyanobium sp. Alchichica 3B3-8F6 TaxID=2823696 RepID=UPI0020CDFAD8|nr:hypothetical protein [Cyanobium sp. Alchichica 3B3-8F6]MCP9883375.1 hypothetical protein [Cyanobium sp. Alchichica 3B3-8F6]